MRMGVATIGNDLNNINDIVDMFYKIIPETLDIPQDVQITKKSTVKLLKVAPDYVLVHIGCVCNVCRKLPIWLTGVTLP